MKKAVIHGTTDVRLKDILNDVAIQIGSKKRFGTDRDDSNTFNSSISLEED
jgi:hypothetical protein